MMVSINKYTTQTNTRQDLFSWEARSPRQGTDLWARRRETILLASFFCKHLGKHGADKDKHHKDMHTKTLIIKNTYLHLRY